jgi:hypothetical protein
MGKEDINLWREKEKSFGLDIKVRFPRLIWVLRCRPEHLGWIWNELPVEAHLVIGLPAHGHLDNSILLIDLKLGKHGKESR